MLKNYARACVIAVGVCRIHLLCSSRNNSILVHFIRSDVHNELDTIGAGLPSGIIGHTWTLAVEEQFYLVWPLLLTSILSLERKWRPLAVFLLICLSFAWRSWLIFMHGAAASGHVFFGSDTRAMEIFIGCLLAFVWNKRAPDWLLALWPVTGVINFSLGALRHTVVAGLF